MKDKAPRTIRYDPTRYLSLLAANQSLMTVGPSLNRPGFVGGSDP